MSTTRVNKQKLRWFTLIEILITISVVSIGLIAVFIWARNMIQFTQSTQERIINNNITRAGVETIYQIRDSNRLRRPEQKNSCRLKAQPIQIHDDCAQDEWIQTWRYSIQSIQEDGQNLFGLRRLDIEDFSIREQAIQTREHTKICLDQEQNCTTETTPIIMKAVEVLWLYDKTAQDQETIVECNNGLGSCWSWDPKELRFCVHTHHQNIQQTHTMLCSIITNFK